MRKTIWTEEFSDFYNHSSKRVREKLEYILLMIDTVRRINAKFVKKLTGTDYYELRLSADNEYRIIVYPVDGDSFDEATEIVLLNGFVKKSTKDYKKQLTIADNIIKRIGDENTVK